MSAAVSRRDAITAAVATGAAAAMPITGIAAASENTFAWTMAWADYQRIQREHEEANRLYEVAAARFEALRPSIESVDTANLPGAPFVDRQELENTYDTEKAWAQFLAGEDKCWWAKDPETRKAKVRAALDSLDAYRKRRDHARAVTKLDAYGEASDETGDRLSDAESRLWKLPAPNGEAVLWKVRRLFGPDCSLWESEITDQVFADLEQFLGGRA